MKHTASVVLVLTVLGIVGIAMTFATTAQAIDIPAALKPWKNWVLHDEADRQCPGRYDNNAMRRCWWLSRLAVDAGDQGALFDLQATVYATSWVRLPGNITHWPESVATGKVVLPVMDRDGHPSVRLEPGDYIIRGAFLWNGLPEMLQLPPSAGFTSLRIDGRPFDDPDLDSQGRLRLHGKGGATRREDTMSVNFFRLIEDDIPMRVTTRIMLKISGQPREIRLSVPLPDRGTVMKIDSPLPARLAGDGDLLLQARPGQWDIRVTVRMAGLVNTLSAGKSPYGDEIWSFKAFNHLRMVKVSGAPTLEPSRTRMPDAWMGFPAYLLKPGASLNFEQIRRGDPDPAPDQLNLTRNWWLDFDGAGITVHDRIHGTLSRSWHLSLRPPMQLGRVNVDGRDQLITLQGDPPVPGVQLRRGRLSLEADSRLPRSSSALPAVGWDNDFQNVRGLLHLPPGWSLFFAGGVDVPPAAWLQRWTLLDFFLVLIIAVSTYKIRNRAAGILALATLVLTFHEPGAPRYVWLHLLAVAALLRFLPDGWFKSMIKLWGAAAVVVLIAIALPFTVQQIRSAIYPQLAPGFHGAPPLPAKTNMSAVVEEQMVAAPAPSMKSKKVHRDADAILSNRQTPQRQSRLASDPDALIQTGPGLPAWQWQTMQLGWNGPVDRTQQIRLWLVSPAMNSVLGMVRVVLLLALTVAFLDLRNWRRHLPTSMAGSAPTLVLIGLLLASVQPLRAETVAHNFPPQPLLDELRRRLIEPPDCIPHCADVSRLELAATPDQLRLIMQVHASVDTAIPLPATLDTWRPNRILLDNQSVKSLSRDEHGALWLVLPRGVHQVKLIGPPGNTDKIRISFPLRPHLGTYAGVGWRALGFGPDGKMDATISLTRVADDGRSSPEMPKTDISAFFHVTQTLHLGIQWEVTTHIRRLTEPGKPAVLSVPLLQNASVTTPGIRVRDGFAHVSLGPQDTEARYTASIPIASSLKLTAPREVPWTETWILDAATMWRCNISGLTVIHHQDADHNWRPQWHPWPGEQVSIDISRPAAVAGRTTTVDSSRLTLTPGRRFARAALSLTLRSSKGGQHHVELPEMANLQKVALNGKSLPIRQDGQLVTVPLEPGNQMISLEWLQLSGAMARFRAPRVNIGDTAVNAAVTFQMPDNRWILLTGGPRLGPAVLFWSYLIVVVLAAVGLGKTTLTPLTTSRWLLLGLGLTQVPAPVAILIVGWLLALGYRCRKVPQKALAFNGTQMLLVILTLAALAGLYLAIERGLLGIPDMQIAGNGSTRFELNWTQDRIGGTMPTPWVISLPQWIYHLLMLAWSLWLAFNLVAWLRWGWGCFSTGGLWKTVKWRRKTKPARREPVQGAS